MIGCRVKKRVQLPLEFGAEGAKDTFAGYAFVSDFWEGESQVGACFSHVVLTLRLDKIYGACCTQQQRYFVDYESALYIAVLD